MPTIALQAHYDGRNIVLDEPFSLPTDTALIVTILPAQSQVYDPDLESDTNWMRASASSDAFDFLADASEDIYTMADGKPFDDAV